MLDIPILGKIDPNTAGVSALLWVIVIFLIWFISAKYWPHYVKERWPRQQAQKEARDAGEIEIEKHRNAELTAIKENLIKLTALTEANLRLLEAHDRFSRDNWQEAAAQSAAYMAKFGMLPMAPINITDNTGK